MKIIIQVEGMEDQVIEIKTQRNGNEYEAWTDRQKYELKDQWNQAIQEFCDQESHRFQRTPGAIRCRLQHLGLLPKNCLVG